MASMAPSLRIAPASRRPGGLARTISAYDRIAHDYANRFKSLELVADIARFAAGLSLEGAPVLDAGCGHGRDCALLERRGFSVIGLDLSAGLLSCASQMTGASLVRSDLRRAPFPDGSFGGVWCCAVLLHLDNDDFVAAASELARVARPGAPLFVSVRHGDGEELREEAHGEGRWYRLYNEGAVIDMLTAAGFLVGSCDVGPGASGGCWINIHGTRT